MPTIDNTSINMNNKMLFKLADCFGSATFVKTFTKVYSQFRTTGATLLQWRALRNMFRDVFSKENKDAWRGILILMQKTCITFPEGANRAISYLWNGDILADNGDYEGWVIED